MRGTGLWLCYTLYTAGKWIAVQLNIVAVTRIRTPVSRVTYPAFYPTELSPDPRTTSGYPALIHRRCPAGAHSDQPPVSIHRLSRLTNPQSIQCGRSRISVSIRWLERPPFHTQEQGRDLQLHGIDSPQRQSPLFNQVNRLFNNYNQVAQITDTKIGKVAQSDDFQFLPDFQIKYIRLIAIIYLFSFSGRIMCLSEISGYGVGGLISQSGNTINSP